MDNELISETITAASLPTVWVQCRPLIDSALAHAQGELNSEQIRRLVSKGQMHLVVAHDRTTVHAVMVAETVSYPGYTAFRVVVFAGCTPGILRTCLTKFWPGVLQWAVAHGCTKIESMCHPSMARLLARVGGFKQKYVVMNLDI